MSIFFPIPRASSIVIWTHEAASGAVHRGTPVVIPFRAGPSHRIRVEWTEISGTYTVGSDRDVRPDAKSPPRVRNHPSCGLEWFSRALCNTPGGLQLRAHGWRSDQGDPGTQRDQHVVSKGKRGRCHQAEI